MTTAGGDAGMERLRTAERERFMRTTAGAPTVTGGGDPTRPKTIPPPAAGDLLAALCALAWPAVEIEGRGVVAGEATWRATIDGADPEERLALWRALGEAEPEELA